MFQRSDQLPTDELIALRQQQRQVTAEVARNWLPEPHLGPIEPKYGIGSNDRYQLLGRAFFISYLASEGLARVQEQYPVLVGSSVLNGFEVATKILSYAPEAYLSYCRTNSTAPDTEELASILHDSSDSLWFFTDCSNETNRTLELWFGLKLGRQTDDNPFEITDTDGAVHFQPSRDITKYAGDIPELYFALRDQKNSRYDQPYRSCSGKAIVAKLWGAAIDVCTSDPYYFQSDIDTAIVNPEVSQVQ